jgi:hypothetical protein
LASDIENEDMTAERNGEVEAPKAEAPKVESPKIEAPKTEAARP